MSSNDNLLYSIINFEIEGPIASWLSMPIPDISLIFWYFSSLHLGGWLRTRHDAMFELSRHWIKEHNSYLQSIDFCKDSKCWHTILIIQAYSESLLTISYPIVCVILRLLCCSCLFFYTIISGQGKDNCRGSKRSNHSWGWEDIPKKQCAGNSRPLL